MVMIRFAYIWALAACRSWKPPKDQTTILEACSWATIRILHPHQLPFRRTRIHYRARVLIARPQCPRTTSIGGLCQSALQKRLESLTMIGMWEGALSKQNFLFLLPSPYSCCFSRGILSHCLWAMLCMVWTRGVPWKDGQTVLTWIPNTWSSCRSDDDKAAAACLEAQYALKFMGDLPIPAMLAILRMREPL